MTAPLDALSLPPERYVRRRRSRRRSPWPVVVVAAASMVAVLIIQLGRPVPVPRMTLRAPAVVQVPGSLSVPGWPAAGQGALSVPAAGLLLQSGPAPAAPIASLTKMMTAYVVLRDHPIDPADSGAQVEMTAADVQDLAADAAGNDTSIPITAGQFLSERQLLDGLLVHSANNFADALARWDAGGEAGFVSKMNSAAASLGMDATRYTDPSGIDPGDVSTPDDQLRLAQAAMAQPTFAAVVAQPAITEPGAGVLSNYVPMVGTEGVVGVKSGFTQAAGGCLVMAVDRQVDGRSVMVLVALLGQQGGARPIEVAEQSALTLVDGVTPQLHWRTLIGAGRRQGWLSAPWSHRVVTVSAHSNLQGVVWPGERIRLRLDPDQVGDSMKAGTEVATMVVSAGQRRVVVPVRSDGPLLPPTAGWRLLHS